MQRITPTLRTAARRRGAAAATLCMLVLAPTTAVAQSPSPANSPEPPGPTVFTAPDVVVPAVAADPLAALARPGDTVLLSDEERTTRWAHAQDTSDIRSEPRRSARAITRLRFLTEDGKAEVYPVLGAKMDSAKRTWLNIRIPMRPNGRTGWVPVGSLSQFYVVRTQFVVDRSKLTATLYKQGKRIWHSRVGIGKPSTPTPKGRFWIRERLKGLGDGTTYGPWAFGTSAYSNISDWPGGGVVGIHGTNQPNLIPGRPSHGCVRVPNGPVRRLARLMPIGTPVLVVG